MLAPWRPPRHRDARRLYHPGFQAQLNARRVALWSTAQDRIRALLHWQAVDAIAEDLQSPGARRGDARLAAAQVSGIGAAEPRRLGPIDPETILETTADEAAERQEADKPYRATKEQRAALEDKLLRAPTNLRAARPTPPSQSTRSRRSPCGR